MTLLRLDDERLPPLAAGMIIGVLGVVSWVLVLWPLFLLFKMHL